MTSERVADLTMEQLEQIVRRIIAEERPQPTPKPPTKSWRDVRVLSVDANHPALKVTSRKDLYDDED